MTSARRPFLLSIVTIFMIISGVLSLVAGIALVALRNNEDLLRDSGEDSSTVVTIGVLTIIAGLISIWLATALRHGSRFARMLVFIFEAANIIGAIWALVALHDEYRLHSVVTIIVSLAVIGYLYASAGAKAFFHDI